MAESATFFWYDYETFGRDPARDRVAQFAGLRTDEGLNVLGEPSMFFCQPPEDYLPHPEACLITGITPQQAREQGLVEREFTAQVHAELARPGTCSVGYNSIRFDDEFTRYLLFRNFHDPYAREWTGNNSRWDLLDVMRMARLLRPDGLEWPDREGRPSFRLEDLTRTNGIEHGAHDALADARATLELARRLRAAQPRLWDYALRARDKRWVLDQLDLRKQLPVLHVSGRFAAERGAAALVLPLAPHPTNRNSIIVCNLGADPGPLLGLDAATLRRLLYARSAELPPGMERIPLKEIHANKSPMLAPESMLTAEVAARCGIDHAACRVNRERLLGAADLPARLAAVYAPAATPAIQRDPEADLYGGSFLGDADRRLAERVRAADAATLAGATFPFADPRLPELLFRYRARNFPDSLNPGERARWREHCATRLHGESVEGLLNCAGFRRSIAEARAAHSSDAAKQAVLDRLEAYGEELCARSSPSPGLRPPSPASGRGDEAEICGAPPSPARGRGEGGEGGGP